MAEGKNVEKDRNSEIYRPAKKEAEAKKIVKEAKPKAPEKHVHKESKEHKETAKKEETKHKTEKKEEKKEVHAKKAVEKKEEMKKEEKTEKNSKKGKAEKKEAEKGKDDKAGKGKDEKKEPEKKKKVKQKSRKVMVRQSDEMLAKRRTIATAADNPTFRGRFGKRNIRKKSKAKWDKWRVPRGIDVKRVVSDGFVPKVGYSKEKSIRNLHPSGFREVLVRGVKDFDKVPTNTAIRISAGIGKRKKLMIVDRAIEKGIKVLNP